MTSSAGLMAGAAEIEITPPLGTQIAGGIGTRRPVAAIEQPLYARALALQQGNTRLCYLTSDVLAIRDDFVARIRREVRQRYRLAASELVVNCTQNHAAPSVGHCFCLDESFWRRWISDPDLEWVLGGDPAYSLGFMDRAVTVIGQALDRLQPVSLHAGRTTEGRLAYNRRTIMRDGTARMHAAAGDPRVLQIEGPIDPEVAMAVLKADDGRPVAALLHFSSHPDHGIGHQVINGGWCGAWCEMMKPVLDGGLPFVVNGCCGNLHPRNPLAPETTKTYSEMGRILTADCIGIMDKLVPADGPLRCGVRRLQIPLRDLDIVKVRRAEQLLDQYPEPLWTEPGRQIDWSWIYAISILDLAQHKQTQSFYDYEVQAFGLGDVHLLALTGEPFVEGQLAIKLQAPAAYTLVAHMSNGYVGYIPTPDAIRRGGYETEACHWSKLAPEALDQITQTAIDLLRTLGDI